MKEIAFITDELQRYRAVSLMSGFVDASDATPPASELSPSKRSPKGAFQLRRAAKRNADSALTGKIFLIQAETEDGELEQISIVAPPPAD